MAISLFQFANTTPSDGTINLLFSESINRDGLTSPRGQVTVTAATVPFNSANGIDIEGSLQQLNQLTVLLEDEPSGISEVIFNIRNKSRKSGYYFLQFSTVFANDADGNPVSQSFISESNTFNSFDGDNFDEGPIHYGSFSSLPDPTFNEEVYMEPFLEGTFGNSDYEALFSNAIVNEQSNFIFKVDRNESQINPTNLEAIVNRSAIKADLQDSNYTTSGLSNARYFGSKINSGSLEGDNPGLSFTRFDASLHELDADNATIASINAQERTINQFFFNLDLDLRTPNSASAKLPQVNTFVYEFDNDSRRYVRVVDSKLFILDNNSVAVTDAKGKVTSITVVS